MATKVASVILDIPTNALDAPYTYALPADVTPVQVGCAVVVPLGSRDVIGFVIGFEELSDAPGVVPESAQTELALFDSVKDPTVLIDGEARTLKRIKRVVSEPYFDDNGAACARFMSSRYLAPLSSCIRLFTPPGGVASIAKSGDAYEVVAPQIGAVDDRFVVCGDAYDAFQPKKNAVKQIAILEAIAQGEVRVAELTAEYGSVASALKTLESKGAIRIEHRRRMRDPFDGKTVAKTSKPVLTPGQKNAVEAIRKAIESKRGDVVVVDGVTGSGKTEVYLQVIEEVLLAGKSACVLVPEISLTPQTVARFRGRFGDTVAVMHSRMSQGERFDQWEFIRSSKARVVVGARSALFTPLANLGIIVIDEEHENSYKQDSAPRYVTRDVARWMAKRNGAALVLGSATPSLESLYACQTDETFHHIVLTDRATGALLPQVHVVDMAKEFRGGSRSMFSRGLTRALERELSAGHKAVFMLNQRGFARFVLCRDCGFVPECPSCSTSLTYHERGNVLTCHHCGYQTGAPATCPECGSPYLRKFGAGTQRVEDELAALIASFEGPAHDAVIIRMDADTTKRKGSHQRLLEQFAGEERAVLLGTQMIAKGLDFADVTLVGVINADTMLKLPDYRAAERTFDLIQQVAGRAGRAALPGEVFVQTYQANTVAIQAAATYNRDLFLADELHKRKLLGYPPYVRMANVLVWGARDKDVASTAKALHAQIADCVQATGKAWEVLEATPCVLAKLRNAYRWHIVVKAPLDDDIASLLEPIFRKRKTNPSVNVTVDIDPESLF